MESKTKKLCLVLFAMLMFTVSAWAQKTVSGTVVDNLGEPIMGANVVENSTNGTITDADGKFTLKNVADNAVLKVSFLGYATQQVSVAGKNSLQVTLQEDSELLDDVVVIGYQTVRRKDLTGSVASVSAKSIATAPVSNVAQALQGKLAGVNVISQDGRPDATISIRVRGGGSISQSNDPLILIDGVAGTLSDIPSDQIESIDVLKDASSTAIYGARGANGVILVTTKGAKEGKTKVTYSGYAKWNTPTKYLEALNPYDYLCYVWANAEANGTYYSEPFTKLFGIGQYGDIERYRNVDTYDVQKDVYNSSFSHSHDLSISGGTEKTKFLFGFNYNDEDGMKVNSYNKRASVSMKVNQQINKRLDFSIDTRYTNVDAMSDETVTSGSGSILSFAYRFRPISMSDIEKYGNPDALREGAVEQYGKQSLWDVYDPYQRTMDYEPKKVRQSLRGTAGANLKILDNLIYHTELSMSRSWYQNKIWKGAIYSNYLDDATGEVQYAGDASLYKADSWGLRWTNTLSYNLEINDDNRLNVLAGYEVSNSHGSSMTITGDHFPANYSKENAFAMINQYDKTASTNQSPFSSGVTMAERVVSYFGRANYTLLDRYLFTFTFRADASSKFSPDNQWGFFPAGAFAWRAKQESFLKDVDWLSDLKLRASLGTVGNDAISSSLWSQTWTSENDSRWFYTLNNIAQGSYDLASTQMANRDLKWETTITRNIGFDFSLFDERLSGTLDLYNNSTKDLLMSTTLPGITGFTSTYANIGETRNRGVELSMNGTIFSNKDWNISAGFNINFNHNIVEKLADGVTGIYGTSWFSSGSPSNDYCLVEGKAVGLVRGLKYVGMYSTDDFDYDPSTKLYTLKPGVADVSTTITGVMHGISTPSGQNAYPGMAKYEDRNNDGTIDAEDYDIIGDMNAKHTGGFNITASYRQWDLGLYFNWSYGNDVYNVNKMATLMGYKESGVFQNKLAILKDSYRIYDIQGSELVRMNTPDELNALNANAKLPLCYNENGNVSSLCIEDGSFLRLNTLTLGYTLPKDWGKKVGIANCRVYGSIYNVFTLTSYDGLDPEVNSNPNVNHSTYPTPGLDWGTYPRARSFVLGLNVQF